MSGKVASVCMTEQNNHAHQSGVHEGTPATTIDPRNVSDNREPSCSEINAQSHEQNPENKERIFGKVENVWMIEQKGYVYESAYERMWASTADHRNTSENSGPSFCSEINAQSYEQNPENKERMSGNVESVYVVEQKGHIHEGAYKGTQKWVLGKNIRVKWDRNRPELSEVCPRGSP
jgi:hypothetical protein